MPVDYFKLMFIFNKAALDAHVDVQRIRE